MRGGGHIQLGSILFSNLFVVVVGMQNSKNEIQPTIYFLDFWWWWWACKAQKWNSTNYLFSGFVVLVGMQNSNMKFNQLSSTIYFLDYFSSGGGHAKLKKWTSTNYLFSGFAVVVGMQNSKNQFRPTIFTVCLWVSALVVVDFVLFS